MSYQYNRNVSLVVYGNSQTGLDLSQMHFQFGVKRGDLQTPNSLWVRVYNLSDQTVQMLASQPTSEFTRVVLQCGYNGLPPDQPYLGTVFDGNIKYVKTGNDNAMDSYIEIGAADGDSAYNFATVNVTLAAGSTANDHLDACLSAMSGVFPSVIEGSIPTYTNKLPRGKVMFGKARDHIRNVSDTVQASWSIQDGQLQLVPIAGYLPGEAIVLNSATGLIGFPQKTPAGIQVRSLINPRIKIGGRIQLDNKSVKIQDFSFSNFSLGAYASPAQAQLAAALKTDADGFYRVLWVEHSGDTRGNEWYSNLICVAVDSSFTNLVNPVAATDEVVYIPR